MTSRKDHPSTHTSHTTPPSSATRPADPAPESVDSRLDEALNESFPASDPVAIDATDPYDPRTKEKSTAHVSPAEKKRH